MGSSCAGTDPKELPEFPVGALVQPKVRWLVGANVVVLKVWWQAEALWWINASCLNGGDGCIKQARSLN